MRYRGKDGRFISEKEYNRRLKISKALKNRKRKSKPREKPLKLTKQDSKNAKSKSAKKPEESIARKRARNIKQTGGKTKRGTSKLSRSYTEKRKQTKVKTIPTKSKPENFFFTDKKQFILRRAINVVEDEKAMLKIKQFLDDISKSLTIFYFTTLKKQKTKKKVRLNLGYYILLDFVSKDGEEHTRFETVSFLEPKIIERLPTKDKAYQIFKSKLRLMYEDIEDRFIKDPENSYIANQALFQFLFKGFEAEMELI